jgi:hypothetical protein
MKKPVKPVKKAKLTLALSHYPPALNCLIGEVILMMVKCGMPFLSPMLSSQSYRIAPAPKKAKVHGWNL